MNTEISGRGNLYSFGIVRRAAFASFANRLPYVVALVELEEDPPRGWCRISSMSTTSRDYHRNGRRGRLRRARRVHIAAVPALGECRMRGQEVAVVGVGYSPITRGVAASRTQALIACRAAIADAGLHANDVDGVFESQLWGESPYFTRDAPDVRHLGPRRIR